ARAGPAHRARLLGVRGRLCARRPEFSSAGRRGLRLAAREPELRRCRRLRGAGDGGVARGDGGLSASAPRAQGATVVIAARRLVCVTGVVALCIWVLLPIYLIGLGALGGRAAVSHWPTALLPMDASTSRVGRFLGAGAVSA